MGGDKCWAMQRGAGEDTTICSKVTYRDTQRDAQRHTERDRKTHCDTVCSLGRYILHRKETKQANGMEV